MTVYLYHISELKPTFKHKSETGLNLHSANDYQPGIWICRKNVGLSTCICRVRFSIGLETIYRLCAGIRVNLDQELTVYRDTRDRTSIGQGKLDTSDDARTIAIVIRKEQQV